MINNLFPTVFAILVVLAAPAKAAEGAGHIPERPAVASPGNTAEAEAILGAKLLVCNTCHGAEGIPRNASVPVIWGQQEAFLLKQLHDFQSGDRDSEVMTWMATALTPSEVAAAAAYFAKKNWPARPAAAASTSPPAGVAVCVSLSSTELRRRPDGAAAGRPKLRISGRRDAPFCRRRAKKQCRHDEHHEGDFARRTGGDRALHIRHVI